MSFATAAVSFAISIYICPQMSLICAAMMPLLFIAGSKIGFISGKVNEKIRRTSDEYCAFEHDSLQMWKEVKLQGLCRRADIWEFICSLDEGLDTVIGERGVRLSGGQRQRVALARTLLRRSGRLILDEATSSLDRVSEDRILESLKNASKNTAVLMISHRYIQQAGLKDSEENRMKAFYM